ncbi:hypothetical protein [Natrinema gari]|uniref:Uncharacterized protein n=1 Tax=Natrinema gari JCM 14663 TaxID=1230459 RepID=L9YW72_9EURY|nr:hypothetical protein [Natrinema gari]ELY77143.1 hypothetical protein C486_16880 [Natrinema gari JCM 14663]
MGAEICDACGLEKIGGRCLTRWCPDRHSSVDDVLGSDTTGSESKPDALGPRAPHWFDFNRVSETASEWAFEILEWDNNPDADDIDDRGEAEVVRGDHRFVVTTWLQPRERTHDRYWGVAHETVNQDSEAEPLAFQISTSQSIAQNNLGHAKDVLDSGEPEPHVLVRDHVDSRRETFEYPAGHMAEKAADLQIELEIGNDDREYIVTVRSKADWEERLKRERALESAGDA